MGDNFVTRSFLFEVVDSKSGKIEKSFTLVLPPQQYSIKERARVTITKTFGNAFIDDYGPDNLEITIKGISGTAHAFPTFRTSGLSAGSATFSLVPGQATPQTGTGQQLESSSSESYNHRDAFYTFRDDIMRYRDRDGWDQKELRVYDLTDEQAYKCVLLEFGLDRTADKPFWYPFTISLFVYARLTVRQSGPSKAISIASDPVQASSVANQGSSLLQTLTAGYASVQSVQSVITNLTANVAELQSKITKWIAAGRSVLTSPLLAIKQTISLSLSLLSVLSDAYVAGKMTLHDWMTFGEIAHDIKRQVLNMYGYAISQGAQITADEEIDSAKGLDYSGRSPALLSDTRTYSVSGLRVYTVGGGDTLQSIAQNQLGDVTLWPYIAAVNSLVGNPELTAGQQLYLPVTTLPTQDNKDSYVLSEDRIRDPYGTDIKVDANGNLVLTESNDFMLVNGLANLIQALNLRLNTHVGSLIKQTAYGILLNIGMPGLSNAKSYIRMAIKSSLLQDLRIVSVDNVTINIPSADTYEVSFSVTPVGFDTSLPVTVLL